MQCESILKHSFNGFFSLPLPLQTAVKTKARSLADALIDADAFLGLSVEGAVNKKMVKSMAKNPIIFAMANPTPEIMPEEIKNLYQELNDLKDQLKVLHCLFHNILCIQIF